MKNLLTAIILGIALAGVSIAQAPSKNIAGRGGKVRVAVVEFTPGPNASGMIPEAKRQLQASIAFSLTQSERFEVADVRNTRAVSQADLAALNGGPTAAAVRVGKEMRAGFVLTGIVVEYNTKGSASVKYRLIEVSSGKVKYSGEYSHQTTDAMRSGSAAEMQTKVMKPLIGKLADSMVAAF